MSDQDDLAIKILKENDDGENNISTKIIQNLIMLNDKTLIEFYVNCGLVLMSKCHSFVLSSLNYDMAILLLDLQCPVDNNIYDLLRYIKIPSISKFFQLYNEYVPIDTVYDSVIQYLITVGRGGNYLFSHTFIRLIH